jgi:multiple sugar transport system ATP-binding protein
VYRNPADTFVAGFLASPPMNLVSGRLEPDQGGLAAIAGSARFVLPPFLSDAYAAHSGSAVTIGLRPEDFHLSPGNVKLSQALPVATVATEVLGPEVILVCELGGKGGPEVMVRCPRDFSASPGQTLTLHYDLSQIHLFDKTTGKVLERPRLA